ncbi:MAG: hypothetical protein SH859_15165 [Hyphomicrobium aestuarii]|nr:hypothetical protein [Hyphomicrobium aestuarii]
MVIGHNHALLRINCSFAAMGKSRVQLKAIQDPLGIDDVGDQRDMLWIELNA